MEKSEVLAKALPFFTSKGYQVQTQTDLLIVFISNNREVNWIIFLVACCLGLIPAVIYYYVFCPLHQVTISFDPSGKVSVTGTTEQAKKDGAEFQTIVG